MKKIVVFLIACSGTISVLAQNTPIIDQRESVQRHRIHQGVSTGELTHREAADARLQQRSIRRTERRAKADGVITRDERARLNHKQNKANRALRRNKHDDQIRTN